MAIAGAVVWAGAIFAVSSVKGPDLPPTREIVYTLAHFSEYAVLAVLLALAFAPRRRVLAWVIPVVVASLYGVTDEVHQLFVPGRTSDPVDWLADTLGACLGAGLVVWHPVRRLRARRQDDVRSRPAQPK